MKNLSIGLFISCFLYANIAYALYPMPKVEKLLYSSENFISKPVKVKNNSIMAGRVEALVYSPARDIEKVLRDFKSYKDFIPFFTGSKLLSRDSSRSVLSLDASIVHGTIDINAIVSIDERKESSGVTRFILRLKKGDLKRLDGIWTIYPVDETMSVLVFDLMIDPGLWFVRDKTLSEYNQVNARRTIRSIRKKLRGS